MSAHSSIESADRTLAIRDLYRTRPRSRLVRASVVLFAFFALYAFLSPDVAWSDLFSARRRSNLSRFVDHDLIPYPLRDSGFSWSALTEWAGNLMRSHGLEAMAATFWISVLAIVIAGLASLLFAPLGAHTLANREPYGSSAKRSGHDAWRALVGTTRVAAVLLRAIPEYVWAFLLLAMLGPTAWPVIIALAIHNTGILTRLGSETIENLEVAPLESLAAVGASRRQLATLVALPLALPRFLLYFFYRFETCIREATVLGMLGVVSLGYWIADARGRQNYDEMVFLVALGAVLILLTDLVSYTVRRWIR